MATHIIYYNAEKAKMMRPVMNRDEYLMLRGSNEQKKNVMAIREGNEALKSRLVQMNYSCLPNDDGSLKGSTRMSNTVAMDIDHIPSNEMQAVRDRILINKEVLGLLMLEVSARAQGYHLVFKRKPELSQEENLRWASQLLEVEYDKGAKDITRVFYTTTASKDDLIYLSDELFETPPAEESNPQLSTVNYQLSTDSKLSTLNSQLNYNGLPYSEIIDKYWEMFHDGKKPGEGDRNTKTYELVMAIRCICDYSLEKLLQVVPNYWKDAEGRCTQEEEAEWRQTIENALKEPRKSIPYKLRQVLQALKSTSAIKICGGTLTSPPPMPRRLPVLIKLLTRNVPSYYKPAVAAAVFPALGAHLHEVKFRYCDNVEHEATFMNVLIGRQSIGKSCVKKPIEFIIADILKRDEPNRQREAEWKQKNPGAKQKKDPRPSDICIQVLSPNLTDAAFNQRVVDAHNNGKRFLYLSVDELDALKKVTSKGTTEEVGLLIRQAFDNSRTGQERVGADSVTGIAPLRWNFNASTTPTNANRFFRKMVNDGSVSRLDIATIVRDEDDNSLPVFGDYDEAFAAELKPFIDRLEAANGLIECPQANKMALALSAENVDNAKLCESQAYLEFSHRANVIAWLKAMVLYVAQGYKWDKTLADFMRWSEQYNLWCKMVYFGQQLEDEIHLETQLQRQSGPQNLLNLLPDEFSRDQYRQMRQMRGKLGDGESTLRSWISRGYIFYDDVTGDYCKTEGYMRKFKFAS